MKSLWVEFYKTILGPQQAYEETLHPDKCWMFACLHPWDPRCKTRAQEMHQWEDFALVTYRPPQFAGRSLGEALSA